MSVKVLSLAWELWNTPYLTFFFFFLITVFCHLRTFLVNESWDGTRCCSLLWCSSQINVAMPSLVKLTWNTLNVISEKKSNPPQDFQTYKRGEKCNTWNVLPFHIIFRGKITDLQVEERNQRKKLVTWWKETWKPFFKAFFKVLKCISIKKGKLLKTLTFSQTFFSEWRPF